MNEIKQVKSELRLKEWAGLIAECQSSTQTVKAWCLEHDMNPKSYYYWLKKVRLRALKELEQNNPIKSNTDRRESGIGFKPLEIAGPALSTGAAVTVHLTNATLEVTRGTDRETIEAVLLALKTVC